MTLHKTAERCARVIARLAEEHGRPNSFSPSEVTSGSPAVAGRALLAHPQVLSAVGATYKEGRIHVE